MKRQTEYGKAKAVAKKLRDQSLLPAYIALVDKVAASITKSMKAINHTIDESGTSPSGEIEFFSFKDVEEKNIRGITKEAEIMFSDQTIEIRKAIIDEGISITNAIALDDELKALLLHS